MPDPACPRSKPRGFSAFQTPRESKFTPGVWGSAAEASVFEIRSPKPQFYLLNLNKSHPRTPERTSAPILPRHEPFLHASSSPKRTYRTPESLVAPQRQEPPQALLAFQNPKHLSRGAPVPSLLLGCPHPCCQADLLRLADPWPSLLPRGISQKSGLGELLSSGLAGESLQGMSPLQSPGRFSQRPCVPLPCPSLPATLPRPPAHPADLLVFCPAWPTFPQLSLGGSQPGPASSATRRPRLGKCGPTPTRSCHWSQRGGWVGWGC